MKAASKSKPQPASTPAVVGRRGAINVNNPIHEQVLGSAAASVARSEKIREERNNSSSWREDSLYNHISEWDDRLCDWIEKNGGPVGKWISTKILRRIVINAPVVLGFCFLCAVVHVIVRYCGFSEWERTLAIQDRIIFFSSPVQQVTSLFTHVLVHSDNDHLKGNIIHILLVGPTVEHEFGSMNTFIIFVIVAVISAFVHILVGNNYTHQLGASGVVFCCILLNSLVSATYGKIPLSFIITAFMYLGDEFIQFFWPTNNISHHAHLSGGFVGAVAGYYIQQRRSKQTQKRIIQQWANKTTKVKTKSR
jgi:rhomboid protease GluP